MTIQMMRDKLIEWHPWWNKKSISAWSNNKVLSIYTKCLYEDEDKAFSKYTKIACQYEDLDMQYEVMEAFNLRF